MNPFVLSFTDGTTFFVGLAFVVVAEGLLLRFQKRLARRVLAVLARVGIILVVISATPLPVWAYLGWVVSALVSLVVLNRTASSRRLRLVACGVLLALTAGLFIAEVPHHRLPRLTVSNGATVYVLGDSISAGTGTKDRTWPTVLAETTTLRVVNLAQAGATVESAIVQAEGIAEPGAVVIVEIGGNDLLGGTDAATFGKRLDTLISSLCENRHRVLVVELPLFPFQNAWGKAQRNVTKKHDAAMLPKRCFAKVFGTKDGTLDGLHLSQAGHNAMAKVIAEVIREE